MSARRTVVTVMTLFVFLGLAGGLLAREPIHELEAPITTINVEENTLVAGGVTIVVTPRTEIELANGRTAKLADLKVGSLVEVQGTVADGKWQAREIEVQRKPLPIIGRKNDHGVEGLIDSIDREKHTLTVGGVLVRISGTTKLKDDDRGKITVTDLALGDYVEVDGTFEGDVLKAKKVVRDDDDDDDDEDED